MLGFIKSLSMLKVVNIKQRYIYNMVVDSNNFICIYNMDKWTGKVSFGSLINYRVSKASTENFTINLYGGFRKRKQTPAVLIIGLLHDYLLVIKIEARRYKATFVETDVIEGVYVPVEPVGGLVSILMKK